MLVAYSSDCHPVFLLRIIYFSNLNESFASNGGVAQGAELLPNM
jgi:hypothetical protein